MFEKLFLGHRAAERERVRCHEQLAILMRDDDVTIPRQRCRFQIPFRRDDPRAMLFISRKAMDIDRIILPDDLHASLIVLRNDGSIPIKQLCN